MIKKLLTSAIAGTCLMGMVGAANAGVFDINLYGASAQYKYWTEQAPSFLINQGCDPDDVRAASTKITYASGLGAMEHGIAWCAGDDTGVATGETRTGTSGIDVDSDGVYDHVIIRYSANASYDGVLSVQGDDTWMPAEDVVRGCDDDTTYVSTLGGSFRLMADETDITWAAYPASPDTGTVNDVDCKEVIIGASDVEAGTFNQESHGDLLGPAGGGSVDRVIKNITVDSDYLPVEKPMVVPFAFFANTDVPLNNLSRIQAVALFSGSIKAWHQLVPTLDVDGDGVLEHAWMGDDYLGVTLCYRHAGSGTHATLDAAIMRGNGSLKTSQVPAYNPGTPAIWFNASSSDALNCVNTKSGSIGYADSDKNDSGSYANAKRLTWMGVDAVKDNIVYGNYDFWSNQSLYYSHSADPDLVTELITYAENNPPAGKPWPSESEMKVKKGTDYSYPKFK